MTIEHADELEDEHPATKIIDHGNQDCPKCKGVKTVKTTEQVGLCSEKCTVDGCSHSDIYAR